MSTYTKRRCPGCGYVVENWRKNNEYWRTHIGPAVEECPKCKRYLRCGSNEEFIMLKNPKWFITQYLLVDLIKSILYGGIIGSMLFFCIDGGELITWGIYATVSIVIMFVLHCIALKRAIRNSLERTSSYEYRQILRNMWLISESQLGEP